MFVKSQLVRAGLALCLFLQNSDASDFGYIDNVEIWGLP